MKEKTVILQITAEKGEIEQHLEVSNTEDIYFFEVNTKYISSSVLKIQMFSTHEMKYIRYLQKKSKFSFYFILFIGHMQCLTH